MKGSRHKLTCKTLTIEGQMIMDRPVANALVLMCMCRLAFGIVTTQYSPLYSYGDGLDTDEGDAATTNQYSLTSHNVWGSNVSSVTVSCRPSD